MKILLSLLIVALAGAETNSIGIHLKLIKPGHFVMGDNHDRTVAERTFGKDHGNSPMTATPAHPVFITRPFYLGVHEVTRGQFAEFANATGYVTTAEKSGSGIVGWHKLNGKPSHWRRLRHLPSFSWKATGFDQADEHPVVGVSWDDAQAFCAWLSEKEGVRYRLPSEAEWEFACRAGSITSFTFGDNYRERMHEFANFADATLEAAHERAASCSWFVGDQNAGAVFTAPVGGRSANAWGLHDMHGNVWEWCADLYQETFYVRWGKTSPTEPRAARAFDPINTDEHWNTFGTWRSIRGGSWCNAPERCRSERRSYWEQAAAACYIGFRVVREAPAAMIAEAEAAHKKQEEARAAITAMPGIGWSHGYGDDMSLQLNVQNPLPELKQFLPLVPRIGKLRVSAWEGEFSPELLQAIGQMTSLRSITFSVGNRLTPEAYLAIAKLPNLQSLTAFRMAARSHQRCSKSLSAWRISRAWRSAVKV